ncbi:hypothetical protein FSW04_05345 [Baekduia soli]|uniref:Uncharacterized protein n=1 Tax=Baekduia soli TaxID=496014 RepID=A0A5B8U240_9ACTN|nr:hypothetical protein [Baekduia soli]QEC47067.1 hypothetical protein FSW04_05345 [Baekduia soli]
MAAIGVITALLAGTGVGVAGAASGHHTAATKVTAPKTKSTGSSRGTATKARTEEREARAMTARERRGPGFPREDRNESRAVQRKELRNHAEVRGTSAATTHKTAPKTKGTATKH